MGRGIFLRRWSKVGFKGAVLAVTVHTVNRVPSLRALIKDSPTNRILGEDLSRGKLRNHNDNVIGNGA